MLIGRICFSRFEELAFRLPPSSLRQKFFTSNRPLGNSNVYPVWWGWNFSTDRCHSEDGITIEKNKFGLEYSLTEVVKLLLLRGSKTRRRSCRLSVTGGMLLLLLLLLLVIGWLWALSDQAVNCPSASSASVAWFYQYAIDWWDNQHSALLPLG